jgi:GNAT superfamily N-acetyltransferase
MEKRRSPLRLGTDDHPPMLNYCMGEVRVSEATQRDLDALLRLYDQLAEDRVESQPASRPTAAPILAAILSQPGRALLVASVADRVVGTADLLVVPNLTHKGMGWAIVENVVVDESQRGTGVGRSLMEEVIVRCREADCYKIQLLSRTHRVSAHAFYQHLGFEPSATGFRLYLDP